MEGAPKRYHPEEEPEIFLPPLIPEVHDWVRDRLRKHLPVVMYGHLMEPAEPPVFGRFVGEPTAENQHWMLFRNVIQTILPRFLDFKEVYALVKTSRLFYRWLHPVLVAISKRAHGPNGTPMGYIFWNYQRPHSWFFRANWQRMLDVHISESTINVDTTIDQALINAKNKHTFEQDFAEFQERLLRKTLARVSRWFKDAGFYTIHACNDEFDQAFLTQLSCVHPELAETAREMVKRAEGRSRRNDFVELQRIDVETPLSAVWADCAPPIRQRIQKCINLLEDQHENYLYFLGPLIRHVAAQHETSSEQQFIAFVTILCNDLPKDKLIENTYLDDIVLRCAWKDDKLVALLFEKARPEDDARSVYLFRRPCMKFLWK